MRCSEYGMWYRLLLFVVAMMPFHFVICELFLSGWSFDNVWRDALILILFLVSIANIKINATGFIILGIAGITLCLSLLSPDVTFAFNIARTYVIPCMVYFPAMAFCKDRRCLIGVCKLIAATGAIISVWGIVEVFILGPDFLTAIGYDLNSSTSYYIGGFYGVPRVLGTFVSPNDAGEFYAIAFLFSLVCRYNSKILTWVTRGSLFFALILTFSRSAIAGLVIVLLIRLIIWKKNTNTHRQKGITTSAVLQKIPASALFALAGALLVSAFFLTSGSVYVDMLMGHLASTIAGADLSAAKHFSDLFEPIKIVVENPFGLGFGMSGPMALERFGDATMVESSIYLVLFDYGVAFGLFYLFPLAASLCNISKEKSLDALTGSSALLILNVFSLLPAVQNYFLLFYFYLILGCYDGISHSVHPNIRVSSCGYYSIRSDDAN